MLESLSVAHAPSLLAAASLVEDLDSAETADGGGKDVFVHISAVERSGLTGLADNQKVGYELQDGRDGRQMAGDLTLL